MSSLGSGGGAASGNAGLDKGRKLLESLSIGKVASQLPGQIGAQFPNPAAVQPGQMATLSPQQRLAAVMQQYGGGR